MVRIDKMNYFMDTINKQSCRKGVVNMARKKGPQVQQAYEYIKQKILSFELAPGMPVSDHSLEQELDMSRSPIREAMLLLTANGLLESTPTGSKVASMTLEDIVEICQVRKAIEVAAINIVMDHGGLTEQQKEHITEIYGRMQENKDPIQNYYYDDLFHSAIMEAAGNKRLVEISERMRLQISRARWLNFVLPNRMADAEKEHKKIQEALIAGDRAACVESMSEHLNRSEQSFKKVLSSPEYSPRFTMAMTYIANMYKLHDKKD